VRGDQAQMQMRLGQAQSIFEGLGARLDLARAQELAREE
jgi:flagellin-specific chaperone FliS